MNELEKLLDHVEPPATAVADDVARGERALGRRRRWRAASVGVAALAVAAGAVGVQSVHRGSAETAGYAATTTHHNQKAHHKARHDKASSSKASSSDEPFPRFCPRPEDGTDLKDTPCAKRVVAFAKQAWTTFHDVLADHLDQASTKLAPVGATGGGFGDNRMEGYLGWGDDYLDATTMGAIEVNLSRSWEAGLHPTQSRPGIRLEETTYQGHDARVGSEGDYLLVQVKHDDGTFVTIDTYNRYGDSSIEPIYRGLTTDQLLAAAADDRLSIPDSVPWWYPEYGEMFPDFVRQLP